jgi:hypothetical protein
MHRFTVVACLAVFAACSPGERQEAADTQEAAAPAAMTLADFAGAWSMRAMTEAGDSVLVEYQLAASADPAGWTVTFPGREPMPIEVMLDGDSLMLNLGTYPSALREGVSVTTTSVARMVDGRLAGTFVAHYQTTDADSVVNGRQEGTRMQ